MATPSAPPASVPSAQVPPNSAPQVCAPQTPTLSRVNGNSGTSPQKKDAALNKHQLGLLSALTSPILPTAESGPEPETGTELYHVVSNDSCH